jgi:alpha-tubulin suppressor-like RCC1 family protein
LRSMQKKVPARLGLDVFAGSPVVMVSCGMTHTLAVTAAGRAWTCGNNKFGQLGHGDTADRTSFTLVSLERLEEAMIVMAACNSFHNAVVTAEGRVWTWGWGYAGCLDHNDEQHRRTPALLAAEQLGGSTIVMVAAGTCL